MKKLNVLVSGVFSVCMVLNVFAQNNCGGAFLFTNDAQPNTQYCFDDATINTAIGAPAVSCGGAPNSDAWYTFTISSGPLDIEVDAFDGPGNRNVNFEVYSSTGPCAGLTSIGCANSGGNGVAENLFLGNLPNGTYYVRFYGVNNSIGSIDLCITATTPVPPPTNDNCATAIPVAVGANGICTEVTGTTVGATASPGVPAPTCAFYSGGDVWFSVVVPASGSITFATDYSTPIGLDDTGMAIYTGTCGALTQVACDDLSGNGLMASISATGLTPGTTVFVRVWQDFNNIAGSFDLCFSEPPTSDNNQDCTTSQGICTDATIGGASNGAGSSVDLNATNRGCLSVEHQASWYNLEVATAGSFEFLVSPSNGTDDYDLAVWVYPGGVGEACPPTVAPTRCTFAAGGGNTGLVNGSGDNTEGAGGNRFVNGVNVNVGDVIVILIDNFSSTTSPFTLDFTGTAGLDCAVVLPVELVAFYGEKDENVNRLYWETATEFNNDYFTIEHSIDGKNWRVVGTVNGYGTSSETNYYSFDHYDFVDGINYYKLYQTDTDGLKSNTSIVVLQNELNKVLLKSVNLMGQEVDSYYHGVVIDFYSDGTSTKRVQ